MEGNKNGNHTVNNEDEDGSVAKQEDEVIMLFRICRTIPDIFIHVTTLL